MVNKIFKVGTIFSFLDFDDTYSEIGMIVSVTQKGNCFLYDIYDTSTGNQFRVNNINIDSEIKQENWKLEYEPE